MNKVVQLTAASLFVTGMSLPLWAAVPDAAKSDTENSAPQSDKNAVPDVAPQSKKPVVPNSQVSTPSQDVLRFTLQHRFNGSDPLPIDTIEIPFDKIADQPHILLKALKDNFSKHLEKQKKPVQIDTVLKWLLPEQASKVLVNLPNVSIKTNIGSNGAGESDLVFPAYRREVPESLGKGLIDWKGLDGKFTFIDKFDNLTVAINIAGLMLNEEGKFIAELGKSSFNGAFDTNFELTRMALNFPLIKAGENADNLLSLKDIIASFTVEESPKGLKLGNFDAKVGHVNLTEKGSKIGLINNFAVIGKAKEQNAVVDYSLESKIDKLILPKNMTSGESLEISYVGNLAFRNLDASALLELQKTGRTLKKDDPMMQMVILGKLMEMSPKLMAKSPEIALTQLTVKTPKGNLQGNVSIKLDGKKATSLDQSVLLSALLGQVDFSIGKDLLKQAMISQADYTMQGIAKDKKLTKEQLDNLKSEADKKIKKFLALKWLVDGGDGNYKLVAEFKDKKLTVNGQVIPLPLP
ncbi:DUF945 family protein [Candidatus Marithioploca araucensis]|uniref:DUF945 family protein n=1 Tax=Candidatus Marithioploca araucensis TaxID=70273 RepID=A0ABT7VTH2_9GAMM|nr:DUF945 family protein [Candidatus Marithioploca araucensis]